MIIFLNGDFFKGRLPSLTRNTGKYENTKYEIISTTQIKMRNEKIRNTKSFVFRFDRENEISYSNPRIFRISRLRWKTTQNCCDQFRGENLCHGEKDVSNLSSDS